MDFQAGFGVDIAMALDVCPPIPAERAEVERACRLSREWARRSRRAYRVPGSSSASSRAAPTRTFGGRAALRSSTRLPRVRDRRRGRRRVEEAIRSITAMSAGLLPEGKPRVFMGVGTPRTCSPPCAPAATSRLRPPDAQRPDGARVHATGRGHDQARAFQGRPRRRSTPDCRCPSAGGTAAPTFGISSS